MEHHYVSLSVRVFHDAVVARAFESSVGSQNGVTALLIGTERAKSTAGNSYAVQIAAVVVSGVEEVVVLIAANIPAKKECII